MRRGITVEVGFQAGPAGNGQLDALGLRQRSQSQVVQVVMQPLDLLRQRYLEQADLDLGFFVEALCQQI